MVYIHGDVARPLTRATTITLFVLPCFWPVKTIMRMSVAFAKLSISFKHNAPQSHGHSIQRWSKWTKQISFHSRRPRCPVLKPVALVQWWTNRTIRPIRGDRWATRTSHSLHHSIVWQRATHSETLLQCNRQRKSKCKRQYHSNLAGSKPKMEDVIWDVTHKSILSYTWYAEVRPITKKMSVNSIKTATANVKARRDSKFRWNPNLWLYSTSKIPFVWGCSFPWQHTFHELSSVLLRVP